MNEDTALKILIEQAQARIENLFTEGGSWVKCSERLPEKVKHEKYFNLKLGGFPAVGKFVPIIGDDEWTFDIDKYGRCDVKKLDKVEWLDESNNDSAKVHFAFKELFQYAENELNYQP